jgi:hypothetical protein
LGWKRRTDARCDVAWDDRPIERYSFVVRAVATLGAGVVALVLGCNGLLGIGDLPGLSDAGGAEAGDTEAGDADAGVADAVPDLDGGYTDGPFCAEVSATFCADFDESDDAAAGWSSSSIDDTTTLELDDGFSRSAPRSLHIVIPFDPPLCAVDLLTKDFGSFSKVRAEVSLLPSATGSGSSYEEGGLWHFSFTVDATRSCSVAIVAKSGANAFALEDDGLEDGGDQYAQTDLGVPFPAGEWRKIVLTIDRRVSPIEFDVSVDDRTPVTGHLGGQCEGPITKSHLEIGFFCTAGQHDVHYDNVRCDITP